MPEMEFEIAGPLLARDGMVRIVRRRRDVLRRGDLRMLALADPFDARLAGRLAIVDVVLDLGQVDLREERLMRVSAPPSRPTDRSGLR